MSETTWRVVWRCRDCGAELERLPDVDDDGDGVLRAWVCPACPNRPVRAWNWYGNEGTLDLGVK